MKEEDPADKGLAFEEALVAVKDGEKVRRAGWVNMWIYLDPEDSVITEKLSSGYDVEFEADSECLMAEDWEIVE